MYKILSYLAQNLCIYYGIYVSANVCVKYENCKFNACKFSDFTSMYP